jgi:hypothetical protein
MPTDNIEMLQTVADGLNELKNDIVFVGGAVAELYADDPASSDIRPTQDVDCTIELSSYKEHTELEEDLRAKGFANDGLSEGIECALGPGADSDRVEIIKDLILEIASLD